MSLEMRTDTETSEKPKSNIWKYFTKERGQDNKITAKCNYCDAKYVKTLGKLSLSLDIWLTVVKSITVHFIDNSWYLQQITLDFIELENSYTEKNIAEELITINSITTDNASNNNIMFSYLELWAKDNTIDFSGNNQQFDDLLPIFDVPTCWNFTYDMVKRALDLKVVFNTIILASEFSDLNNIKLSKSD
ncbi:hypothetical protein RhiirC2_795746 [Rhizophagus irregularis]|uniref:BED-type domain-containing protein n=1 Tax=Rhizophagus irregularis TaxID=588596 RepID=A0A2N1MAZ0_9GLOM|nr:hypothetical protein RhiirC2_795746 [Rhizophagus irregularis]